MTRKKQAVYEDIAKMFQSICKKRPETDLSAILKVLGFTRIGAGSYKSVWHSQGMPDVVIKLAHHEHPVGFNEVENAETCPSNIKPYLVPIVAYTSHIQIQPYVKFHRCPKTCRGRVEGMYDSDARNHTHDEDGNLKIVDYGQSSQWSVDMPESLCTDSTTTLTSTDTSTETDTFDHSDSSYDEANAA